MCGIVGIVASNGSVPLGVLERATRSLAHRGPDDSGTVILRETEPEPVEIGFGNRRLAILDLSAAGHQPMRDPETGNWTVYNGEIYNFREVRERLVAGGATFSSHCDTEVVLKAYSRWGEGCLGHLRGMFAIAIWDAARRRLFLARDPMGIKPLYYAQAGERFLFASEVRTLLETGLLPRTLDPAGLLNFLSFGSVCDPNTLVEGVSALRAGHFMFWERGTAREQMYWDLIDRRGDGRAGFSVPNQRGGDPSVGEARDGALTSEAVEDRLRDCIRDSVRMQMVSDVPVGVFLSGGIDSSSLVALLSREFSISTFSIVFREAEFSEAEFSREVARRFRSDHHEILLSQQDALEAIPNAISAMDQPTIDGINTYIVSEHARAAGIKVALSGLGGDELFAGYSSFRTVPRMEQFLGWWQAVPRAVRQPMAGAFGRVCAASDQNRKLLELAEGNGTAPHPYFLSRMLFTEAQRSLLMKPDKATQEKTATQLQQSLERCAELDAVNRVSYLETRHYMLNTLLRDSDAMSMAKGLEVRVPLIDHWLAERVLRIPGDRKLHERTPKPLLVEALDGALPDGIVHRQKRGFTLPFERWLREDLRREVLDSLEAIGDGKLGGWVRQAGAKRIWEDFEAGKTSWSRPWSLHVLQRWCERNL
jgi:asparagine synthase (glutamine-hydrolysing)